MIRIITVFLLTILPAVWSISSAAADQDEPEVQSKQYVVDIGGGAIFKPKYPGADKYIVYPFPIIGVGRFFIPGVGAYDEEDKAKRSFYVFPSFSFNGKRKSSDSRELLGTNTVDWAAELGAGAGYRYDWVSGFVSIRQGFNGNKGQAADFGINFETNPIGALKLVFGPRATWASNDLMDTYFGVTAAEAAVPGSVLSPYNPSSGFKTVGLSSRISHPLTDKMTMHVRADWDRFVGDAKKSPIIKTGSDNQFSVGVGVSYRFEFDVFE
jgi:outer membrane protein